MTAIRITVDVHHTFTGWPGACPDAVIADALNALEIKMGQLSDKIVEFKTELSAAVARVAEDVAELKRQVTEGTATPEDFASLDEGIAALKAVDPLPDFPGGPPPTGGGGTP